MRVRNIIVAGMVAAGLMTPVVIAEDVSPAAATGATFDCGAPGSWNLIPPAGGSDHAPTAVTLPAFTTGGAANGGIVAIDGQGANQNVWITTAHNHPSSSPHWQNSWTNLGGGTNDRPKVFTTTDAFGNVTVRIRVIGLDGRTWETYGDSAYASGWRPWYLWQSSGHSGYDSAPLNQGFAIGPFAVGIKVSYNVWGLITFNCGP